jgi:hypothetical protein
MLQSVVPNDVTRTAHINYVEVNVHTRSRARTSQHRHGTPEAYLHHLHKLLLATYRSLLRIVRLYDTREVFTGPGFPFNIRTNLASLEYTSLL